MSEEFKNSENIGAEQPAKKPFSVTIPEDDFINDIPAPETDVPADAKPHKVVRYVDNAPKKEPETASKKKKGGLVGEFFAGAAAGAKTVSEGISSGAKTVSEGISAGIKTVSEKKPKAEKPVKEKPVKEKPAKPVKPAKEAENDETQFLPKESKKVAKSGGFMSKLNALPTGAVIGGAAALLVVLVAIILIAATSCSPSEENPSQQGSSGGQITINPDGSQNDPSEVPEEETKLEIPDRATQFADAYSTNNDVVGWLYVPGLEDVDAGVCFSYDSSYPYDKRDVTGKKVSQSYWIDGAYYTHYRGLFGETAEKLSSNTVIFGHSDLGKENLNYTNDDPNGPLFSQLFNFKNPDFAEKTPYIYLTLPGEETVWEVFSVFYNDANATKSTFAPYYKKGNPGDLWYIEPSPGKEEYKAMLDMIQARSLYDYDVEVTSEDKILTLSTCTVAYGLSARADYRFVIVAKLVKDTENLMNKNASFSINSDAPVPSSFESEFKKYSLNWKPSKD